MSPRTRNIIIIAVVVVILTIAAYLTYTYTMNQKAKDNALAYAPDSPEPIDQATVNMDAFLRLIRRGESGQTDDAYTIQFGGTHFDNGFIDHPRQLIKLWIPSMGKYVTSDAAGAYQYLSTTWDEVARACGFTDFSPANQDKGAVYLITQAGAYDAVASGDIMTAMNKCKNIWASLPGSPYGQPTQQASAAIQEYQNYGGTLA